MLLSVFNLKACKVKKHINEIHYLINEMFILQSCYIFVAFFLAKKAASKL